MTLLLNNYIKVGAEKDEIRHYRKVKSDVKKCYLSYKETGVADSKACTSYCHFFNFNAGSPAIEGYNVYFNDIINLYTKIINMEKARNSRILEEGVQK